MNHSGHEPFDADIARFGRYQYTGQDRFSTVRANKRYTEMILRIAGLKDKRVVDVGCGDGTYTRLLREEGGARSVLGIDPSSLAVEAAERFTPGDAAISFRNAVAADLIRDGLTFDVAVYRGVIHHVSEPAKQLADAVRLARTVILLEPNGWNPVLKVLERVSSYHREHGERSYSLGRYRKWIRAAGGELRFSTYFGLVPHFAPDWIVRLGSALEPIIESLPGIRAFVCGQVVMLADGVGEK